MSKFITQHIHEISTFVINPNVNILTHTQPVKTFVQTTDGYDTVYNNLQTKLQQKPFRCYYSQIHVKRKRIRGIN